MGDNELEDGEAYSGEVDNATIDPGISLSYIDDKIQDVLGQFQKSFGDGMSRESSGSDIVLPRSNDAIYSDMGLDYSPSLSVEDSQARNGLWVTSVLRKNLQWVMKKFVAVDGRILSPLPDSLLCLMEKEGKPSQKTSLRGPYDEKMFLAKLQHLQLMSLRKIGSVVTNVRNGAFCHMGLILIISPKNGFAVCSVGCKAVVSSISAASNDILKKAKQPKLDSQNAMNHNGLRHPIPSEIDAPSFIRRDANQSITTAFKEARDLKHTANRLKGEGLEHESTGLYFEAALKFLHVASFLSLQVLKVAKMGRLPNQCLCILILLNSASEFCAHEYEKCKEMAAAALAYKCMEVAYMKAQDVNYAMEASRKSHDAFTHASANPEESYYGPDGITSVKRVLDFSFHDVEGLLHLVRLSMDAISEPCKSGENAVPKRAKHLSDSFYLIRSYKGLKMSHF
ncbi:unnamed protein product [Spirodela intermedia]|uniref:CWZF3/5/7 THD domain-containing protein n=1 Tax=Spirodela intermedia TaxID=51605 RepID=A0A7I8IW75_SPIIN|nr:unnamed protein product [Spirodela intermedia]CAA6662060.1 unnamed protein product [Spirodela intermedia]